MAISIQCVANDIYILMMHEHIINLLHVLPQDVSMATSVDYFKRGLSSTTIVLLALYCTNWFSLLRFLNYSLNCNYFICPTASSKNTKCSVYWIGIVFCRPNIMDLLGSLVFTNVCSFNFQTVDASRYLLIKNRNVACAAIATTSSWHCYL